MYSFEGDFLDFYSKFEQLCQKRGVSFSRVREDLGISQSTMASWKSRGLTPKYETVKKLASYFGVTVDYLLGEEENSVERLVQNISQRIVDKREQENLINEIIDKVADSLNNSDNISPVLELDKQEIILLNAFDQLNAKGQQIAVERVEELTKIPDYQKVPNEED